MSPTPPADNNTSQGGNNALTFMTWFAIGFATGAAAGLLLAPGSGRDTRDALSARLGYAAESSKLYLDKARDMAQSFVETAQEQATKLSESIAAGAEEARRVRDEVTNLENQQRAAPEQES